MAYICPQCGGESVQVKWGSDSQGDGIWLTSFETCEVIDIACGCELTDDQEAAILDQAAKDGPPDWEG